MNPLFEAISEGKLTNVKDLLNQNPKVYNHINNDGDTPILFAKKHHQSEIATYLEECVSLPKITFDKVCGSSYSWMNLEKEYFSSDNIFRNYLLANVTDKWGRSAFAVLMSILAIILSCPTDIQQSKSGGFRDIIYRAQNQWKKIEIFIKHGANVHHLDDEGKHPLVSFLKGLSTKKLDDETVFGYDKKLKQDKAKHYRDNLSHHLKSILILIESNTWKASDWNLIKEQYETARCGGEDLLLLLTKWYPELGNELPDLVNLCQNESVVSNSQMTAYSQYETNEQIELSDQITEQEFEKFWSLMENQINVLCGGNSDTSLFSVALVQYLTDSGQTVSINQFQQHTDVALFHQFDLDFKDIITFTDALNKNDSSKVILFTNRSDLIPIFSKTIRQAKFYYLEKKSRYKIVPCHPILAQLRLTRSLRDIGYVGSIIKVKVYVWLGDLNLCRKIYEFLHKHRELFDISDRFRPKFCCVPMLGRNGFPESLIKVLAGCNKSIETKMLTFPSFALLHDIDYYKKLMRSMKLNIDDAKLIWNPRYDIESYLYDPFLLCSVLSIDKLKLIGNQSIRKALIKLKLNMISFVQSEKTPSDMENDLQKYFKRVHYLFPNKDENTLRTLHSTTLSFFYFHQGKILKFNSAYPSFFINAKDYEVERTFDFIDDTERGIDQVVKNAKMFKGIVSESIASCESICLPSDLIDMFLKLNNNIRLLVNRQIKS